MHMSLSTSLSHSQKNCTRSLDFVLSLVVPQCLFRSVLLLQEQNSAICWFRDVFLTAKVPFLLYCLPFLACALWSPGSHGSRHLLSIQCMALSSNAGLA